METAQRCPQRVRGLVAAMVRWSSCHISGNIINIAVLTRPVYAYLSCLGALQVMLVSYGDCTEMSAACEGSSCCGGEVNFQVISSI